MSEKKLLPYFWQSGHFRATKMHFWCPNKNSETTFTFQTFLKYGAEDAFTHFKKIPSPIHDFQDGDIWSKK